jgi:hypothetical protein
MCETVTVDPNADGTLTITWTGDVAVVTKSSW